MEKTLQEVKEFELHQYTLQLPNYMRDFRQRHVEALAAVKESAGLDHQDIIRRSEIATFMTSLAVAHRKQVEGVVADMVKQLLDGRTA